MALDSGYFSMALRMVVIASNSTSGCMKGLQQDIFRNANSAAFVTFASGDFSIVRRNISMTSFSAATSISSESSVILVINAQHISSTSALLYSVVSRLMIANVLFVNIDFLEAVVAAIATTARKASAIGSGSLSASSKILKMKGSAPWLIMSSRQSADVDRFAIANKASFFTPSWPGWHRIESITSLMALASRSSACVFSSFAKFPIIPFAASTSDADDFGFVICSWQTGIRSLCRSSISL
mmetsp:Transcript_56537/g.137242  ORF Transcript_56537/g.137242 Transcript_56537/m.137242 type:complete len:241 (-) Transcript_56537:3129-3851(-)